MVERVGPMRAARHLASGGRREMGCSPGPPVSCCRGGGGRTKTQSPSQPLSGPQGPLMQTRPCPRHLSRLAQGNGVRSDSGLQTEVL